MNLSQLCDKMNSLYSFDLRADLADSAAESANQEQNEVDWAVIEQSVREKREKLDSMGPVNLESIAEYEELDQRNKFLEGIIIFCVVCERITKCLIQSFSNCFNIDN